MPTKKTNSAIISYTPKQYAALERENLKLQKRIIKLQAENVSFRNGAIAAIQGKPLKNLSDDELQWIIQGSKKARGLHK